MPDKNFEYIQDTQTIVGTRRRQLIDAQTGEEILVDQISKRVYGTKNFWKCYLMDFLSVLGIIDSKQLDVFIFIVENTNQATNLFLGTYKHISKEVGVSEPTIAKIMKKLQQNHFIRKVQSGVWLVNPNILMKGNDTKRQILLSYYKSEEPISQISMTRTRRTPIQNPAVPTASAKPSLEATEPVQQQIAGQLEFNGIECNLKEVPSDKKCNTDSL